jgi:hypothetical protein
MATPKPKKQGKLKGRPSIEAPKKIIAGLRGSDEFREWFDRLIKQLRLPASVALEHGLAALAKERGFEPPPER